MDLHRFRSGRHHITNYSVSKAALRMIGRTLALDHAADGILVNEVAPGIVDAGLSRELLEEDPELDARIRDGTCQRL